MQFFSLCVALIECSLFVQLIMYVHEINSRPKSCEMTYMRAQFQKVDETWKYSHKYSLFLYQEQINQGKDTQRVPVLFIPGNGGSYKQVRSLASESGRRWKQGEIWLDWYAIDLREEMSAFSGTVAIRQRNFAAEVMMSFGEKFFVVGHSMGGVIARSAINMLGIQGQILGLVTLSSPHKQPPLLSDWGLVAIYKQTKIQGLEQYPLISVSGGLDDLQVSDQMSTIQEGLNLNVVDLQGMWTGADHQMMAWCNQAVTALQRIITKIIHTNKYSAQLQQDQWFDRLKIMLDYEKTAVQRKQCVMQQESNTESDGYEQLEISPPYKIARQITQNYQISWKKQSNPDLKLIIVSQSLNPCSTFQFLQPQHEDVQIFELPTMIKDMRRKVRDRRNVEEIYKGVKYSALSAWLTIIDPAKHSNFKITAENSKHQTKSNYFVSQFQSIHNNTIILQIYTKQTQSTENLITQLEISQLIHQFVDYGVLLTLKTQYNNKYSYDQQVISQNSTKQDFLFNSLLMPTIICLDQSQNADYGSRNSQHDLFYLTKFNAKQLFLIQDSQKQVFVTVTIDFCGTILSIVQNNLSLILLQTPCILRLRNFHSWVFQSVFILFVVFYFKFLGNLIVFLGAFLASWFLADLITLLSIFQIKLRKKFYLKFSKKNYWLGCVLLLGFVGLINDGLSFLLLNFITIISLNFNSTQNIQENLVFAQFSSTVLILAFLKVPTLTSFVRSGNYFNENFVLFLFNYVLLGLNFDIINWRSFFHQESLKYDYQIQLLFYFFDFCNLLFGYWCLQDWERMSYIEIVIGVFQICDLVEYYFTSVSYAKNDDKKKQ